MDNVDSAVKRLIEAVMETDIYKEYCRQLERVKQEPGLKEQIDEFRSRNYILQTRQEYDLNRIEAFEREYEDFRENPLVSDFLAAELAFCRMMQEMYLRITEEIHFE
ncbi:MAG: YlbF family regulator [Roseburia sp.]|nr:YlbF family regulator [Roseburia sp.]